MASTVFVSNPQHPAAEPIEASWFTSPWPHLGAAIAYPSAAVLALLLVSAAGCGQRAGSSSAEDPRRDPGVSSGSRVDPGLGSFPPCSVAESEDALPGVDAEIEAIGGGEVTARVRETEEGFVAVFARGDRFSVCPIESEVLGLARPRVVDAEIGRSAQQIPLPWDGDEPAIIALQIGVNVQGFDASNEERMITQDARYVVVLHAGRGVLWSGVTHLEDGRGDDEETIRFFDRPVRMELTSPDSLLVRVDAWSGQRIVRRGGETVSESAERDLGPLGPWGTAPGALELSAARRTAVPAPDAPSTICRRAFECCAAWTTAANETHGNAVSVAGHCTNIPIRSESEASRSTCVQMLEELRRSYAEMGREPAAVCAP